MGPCQWLFVNLMIYNALYSFLTSYLHDSSLSSLWVFKDIRCESIPPRFFRTACFMLIRTLATCGWFWIPKHPVAPSRFSWTGVSSVTRPRISRKFYFFLDEVCGLAVSVFFLNNYCMLHTMIYRCQYHIYPHFHFGLTLTCISPSRYVTCVCFVFSLFVSTE